MVDMHNHKIKRRPKRLILITILANIALAFTLIAIFYLAQNTIASPNHVAHSSAPLLLSLIGLGALSIISAWQIILLIKRLRAKRSASRLALSFALRMLGLSLFPIIIMGAFSAIFLSYDLSRTFNRDVEIALEDALELTRSAINMRARQAIEQNKAISYIMSNMNFIELIGEIESLRRNAQAIETSVFDNQGNLVAFAHQNLELLKITPPSQNALLQVNRNQEYFEFLENADDGYLIKVITPIQKNNHDRYYLQATYTMPTGFNELAENVRQSYQNHQSFLFLQPHITLSLILVLSLILILSILLSLFISSHFGETMTRPVQQLIDGTKKASAGDFSLPITDLPNNDLGLLGDQFNKMLLALQAAEEKNQNIQHTLSTQNTFLNTLLNNLNAGVLTLDQDGKLSLANHAAYNLLNTDLNTHLKEHPPQNKTAENSYEELFIALDKKWQHPEESWQQEIILKNFSKRKVLMCHGAPLNYQNQNQGQIIVLEDITELQQNQRNAAWEEVAKRLAHEIKNPLTPIRLQSERLQRKLQNELQEKERNILNRATHTIINQVEAMQAIVEDFQQIAKPIQLRRQNTNINALFKEIANLYPDIHFIWQEDPHLPSLLADPIALRQVFHNLLKNAKEAVEGKKTQILYQSQQKNDHLEIGIEDNGTGFQNLEQDPFEPYVSNKPKGTGLGLAIVKKIIQEHQGSLHVGHGDTLKGAKITLILPIEKTT